jgi:hypothetical protein
MCNDPFLNSAITYKKLTLWNAEIKNLISDQNNIVLNENTASIYSSRITISIGYSNL